MLLADEWRKPCEVWRWSLQKGRNIDPWEENAGASCLTPTAVTRLGREKKEGGNRMGANNHILVLLSGEILTVIRIGAHFPLVFWGLTTRV